MDEREWMNDPALEGIDKSKLAFLEKLVIKSSSMTQKEMLPFLLSLSKLSRENNISFDKNEIQLIILSFGNILRLMILRKWRRFLLISNKEHQHAHRKQTTYQ